MLHAWYLIDIIDIHHRHTCIHSESFLNAIQKARHSKGYHYIHTQMVVITREHNENMTEHEEILADSAIATTSGDADLLNHVLPEPDVNLVIQPRVKINDILPFFILAPQIIALSGIFIILIVLIGYQLMVIIMALIIGFLLGEIATGSIPRYMAAYDFYLSFTSEWLESITLDCLQSHVIKPAERIRSNIQENQHAHGNSSRRPPICILFCGSLIWISSKIFMLAMEYSSHFAGVNAKHARVPMESTEEM